MSEGKEPQEEVLALLGDPATHGGAKVTRIDTHAASVFLAAERAYKVKRAVKFPFLDYSTAAKRKAACEAELEVNRPFAPQLYLGVVAITRAAGGLALGGKGEAVEWAVEMRRFDENATLDHLADRGKIDAALADALARATATAHARAPRVEAGPEGADGDGGVESSMPGLIIDVMVAVGDTVSKGAPLLVLEAMKMEHTLTAPFDGVVASLSVKKGDRVAEHVLLVKLDASEVK